MKKKKEEKEKINKNDNNNSSNKIARAHLISSTWFAISYTYCIVSVSHMPILREAQILKIMSLQTHICGLVQQPRFIVNFRTKKNEEIF